ncbi:MAG: SUMF1/EgtB/PvdO family nonheme iron enzyme [Verrucomicrobiae bacterium]
MKTVSISHSEFVERFKNNQIIPLINKGTVTSFVAQHPETQEYRAAIGCFSALVWIGSIAAIILLFVFWPIALILLFVCWFPLRAGIRTTAQQQVVKTALQSPSFYRDALSSGVLSTAELRSAGTRENHGQRDDHRERDHCGCHGGKVTVASDMTGGTNTASISGTGFVGPTGMALIPARSFSMGDALDGLSDAAVHTVSVSAFYMDKFEVTKALWDDVRDWGLTNGYTDLDAGGGKATIHPAQTITWYAAVKWCNARSEMDGLTPCYTVSGTTYKTGQSDNVVCNWSESGYRLPTEAEWEKAARGGLSGKRFPWGDTISHTQANYFGNNGSPSYDLAPYSYNLTYKVGVEPYTSPVGSFAANGYGLNDMAGNVFEWCWDWYGTYGSGTVTDPTGPSSGSYRVLRAGGWGNYAFSWRVADRNGVNPAVSSNSIGFRCACSSVP